MKPVIFGLSGPVLTPDEVAFFADARPAGYILFGRNIVDVDQVHRLTDSLRDLHGAAALPILIDQEGGRVARLRPPHWPEFPNGEAFDRVYRVAPITAIEAARTNARALGTVLSEAGISVNCTPLLDVRGPATHGAIGDRALGRDPIQVAALGRATLDGLSDAGVVGVVKHMPGQGRANLDSHHALPVVDADEAALATDLEPFRTLADALMGMTCHVVFAAWDAVRPATLSPAVIADVIRGRIGFDGLLMSDDLDMKALNGAPDALAAACVAAGCDVALNCWGRFDEIVAVAAALPEITAAARDRLARAMASPRAVDLPPLAALIAQRDALLAAV